MGQTKHDGLAVPGRVVLAHEPPFDVGPVRILPSTRELIFDSCKTTLEPRVMQVLVALFRANGEVLTREELIDLCWGGCIVGDDAIHRVISRLRRVADQNGGAFQVRTIPRVGYQLVGHLREEPAACAGPEQDNFPADPQRRRLVLAGAGAAVFAFGLGGLALVASPKPHEPSRLAKLYYQRGIEALGQNSVTHAEQAVAYFRRATQIDPSYAQAWGALAWGYRGLLEYGPRSDADRLRVLAQSAADRALELDPANVDAEAALILLAPFYRNWAAIEHRCRELLAKHPTHSITRFNLASVTVQTGRWRAAIPHLQELVGHEPFWPLAQMDLFRSLRNAGRLEEAEEQLQAAERLWPRHIDIWSAKLRHLLLSGRGSEAWVMLADENAHPPDGDRAVAWGGLVARAYLSDSRSEKQHAVDELLSWVRKAPGAAVPAATDCCLLNDVDSSLALLRGYYFGRGEWSKARWSRPRTEFLFNSIMLPLRRDDRFGPLVEEIGLERFWNETGKQPDYRRFA